MDNADQSKFKMRFCGTRCMDISMGVLSFPPTLHPFFQLDGLSQNINSHVTNTKMKKYTSTSESPLRSPLGTIPYQE